MAGGLDPTVGRRIRVRGLVQGVGFRPHVWRLAHYENLCGHVLNDGAGVEIVAWGKEPALERFLDRLKIEAPPLARVDGIDWTRLAEDPQRDDFIIAESGEGAVSTGVVPDAATCPACLADTLDPANRRYRYPFTNCTHCGPRLSIVQAIPYDRASTSMSVFAMCEDCAREYGDPADRRFHAQPNACPVCGPQIWLEDGEGNRVEGDTIDVTARLIEEGRIVAIKGIGGFHLACDATSGEAVAELRRRKRRDAKPLAVMVRDVEQARRYCHVVPEETELFAGKAAPIVLLFAEGGALADGIAPRQDQIGVMLPYTPLHHLLMRALDRPIVLTSGNLSEEPQVIDNDAARERLAGIADSWLMHDRDIVNRLDDSVVRLDSGGPTVLRRARGMAPEPLRLAEGFADDAPVLAMGGELKSTFCLMKDGQAILSQHIGDLEEAGTHADYRKMLALYRDIFRFEPEVIAVDAHPDYLSTQWGEALAAETGARLARVQHHHAHLASVLAEHGIEPGDDRTLGIVLDGLGLGDDGTLWGGELLVGAYCSSERVGHFAPVQLPGGAQAMREPWRNTVAHLHALHGEAFPAVLDGTALGARLAGKPLGVIARMIAQGINAPLSSSAGRLFDAVAAALGICFDRQSYEGQAAMEMEALARPHLAHAGAYPLDLGEGSPLVISWAPLWDALIGDLKAGVEPGIIAARFHAGLADGLATAAGRIAGEKGLRRAALSGGVMQNRILLAMLSDKLARAGLEVLVHNQVPANDGGLALGQAVAALSHG
ncbi:MAG: carbamoyltransferase HypF [Hyphomicrobiales bacterium]|nr:MAG: carbamoyltransferase HypF [Hyphomicrobiales bacterium]